MVGRRAVDNADFGSLAFLTNPKVVSELRRTPRQSSGVEGNFIMEEISNLLGYQVASTNQAPSNLAKGTGSNLSSMIFGNFSDLVIGEWSAIDINVDPYSLSTTGGVRITAFHDVDVAVRNAQSFAAITDMITT